MSSHDCDDDPLTPQTPDEEAAMQAVIDEVMAPYVAVTPPSLVPILRECLADELRTHTVPRQLIRAFVRRKPVVSSGEVSREAEAEARVRKEGA